MKDIISMIYYLLSTPVHNVNVRFKLKNNFFNLTLCYNKTFDLIVKLMQSKVATIITIIVYWHYDFHYYHCY